METPQPAPDAETFGARSLEEWRSLGGPMSSWSYAEIQELRVADREGMVKAQRIRVVESPELLAQQTLAQAQAAANMNVWLMFALLT